MIGHVYKKHSRLISLLQLMVILLTCLMYQSLCFARLANHNDRGLYARSIDEVLALPDNQVDLATAALIVSEEWSDVVHGLRYRKALDDMAQEIKDRLKENHLRANYNAIPVINRYLFKELGYTTVSTANDPNDLFLHSVMDRRRGYCLSLSTLYLALGERLGLPLHGVVVPGHFFVRYDSGVKRFNIECTAKGAEFSDNYYIKQYRVPDKHDRLYLKNLSKKQTLGCLFNNFGTVYMQTGQSQLALMALDRSAQINPKLSEARSNLSIVLQSQGQQASAIEQLEEALRINPQDAAVHREIGRVHIQGEQFYDAITSLNKSLELDKNIAETHILLADAYFGLNNHRPARESLEQALKLDPKHVYAHLKLGQLYRKLNNYQQAIVSYKKAQEIDPRLVAAKYGLAYCYHDLGWHDNEIAMYQDIIRQDPEAYAAIFNIGQFYANQEEYKLASEYFKQATQVNKQAPDAYCNLAVCYDALKKPELAYQAFTQALDIDPDLAVGHYGLGVIYTNRGDFSMAWEHLNRAKTLGYEVPEELLNQVAQRAGYD